MRVSGTVQGVGFRPFVYRHAVALGLSGYVLNDSEGVLIEVEGPNPEIDQFTQLIRTDAPPLARVTAVQIEQMDRAGVPGEPVFRILDSVDRGAADVPVSIDTTTCPDCLAEIDDPADRRYRYPFTNCTNCGPRYTIVLGVPYDRPATTMAGFPMCDRCAVEYHDPADRRFHAQPNACPVCGPSLTWQTSGCAGVPGDGVLGDGVLGDAVLGDDALRAAVAAVVAGQIVAMKGIGGYHLVADATNAAAIAELRRRKARDDKPFAVMVPSLEAAHRVCHLDERAVAALSSIRRPIVLARRRMSSGNTDDIADGVAPGLPEIGVMLAYSPLHHLLLGGADRPLVMTSGNLSDEPIAHHDDDAAVRLGPLVDGMLLHDRPIHIRCDDSVVRSTRRRVQVLRRSRGYAPEPLRLPFRTAHQVLAVGAELKSTVSVAKHDWVVPSHHIGDLEHLATYQSFLQAVDHLAHLYGVKPDVVALDMHPEYLSSKFAAELDLVTVAVQHHHAHVAACMVDHGRTEPVLGIAYDGLGYGPDGSLWGGELLVADFMSARRVAHLLPVRMPGGTAAIREPWRMAAVWLSTALGADVAASVVRRQRPAAGTGPDDATVRAVLDLAERSTTPLTTSAGRLFDAVAALLGGRQRVSYEAQAAIELEAWATTVDPRDARRYDDLIEITGDETSLILDPAPLIGAIVDDVHAGVDRAPIAAGFHDAFGRATVELACMVATAEGIDTVALTGGVFQNARLTEVVESGLIARGLNVLVHTRVPANDGGISIGQAAIAAALS